MSIHRHAIGWSMWSFGALFFFAHYIVRVSPSIVLPDIMQHLSVTAREMGLMATAFYVGYVGMQVPMGMLVDRFGVRKLLTLAILLAAASTYLFSHTNSMTEIYMARFALGIASTAAFLSAIKLATAWLPAQRLALAIGVTQLLGMFGGWIGSDGIEPYFQAYDWQTIFNYLSWALAAFGLLALLCVRNGPVSETQAHTQSAPSRQDFKKVIACKDTWVNALFCGFLFAPMAIYGEFWGPSYLQGTQALSTAQAGHSIGFVFLGWGIGAPIAGYLADRYGNTLVMRFAAFLGLLFISTLMLAAPMSENTLGILNFCFGLSNSGLVAAYAQAGTRHAPNTAAFALAIANMFTILVGAILTPLVGILLERQWAQHQTLNWGIHVYTPEDFQWAFIMLPLCFAAALCLSFYRSQHH